MGGNHGSLGTIVLVRETLVLVDNKLGTNTSHTTVLTLLTHYNVYL
jgi:hypothetical protein